MADNTLDQLLHDFADPDLLIIDDLTHSPRKPEEDYAAVFYELVQRRYRRGSFIISTNLGFTDWAAALGTAALVTPALDRLIEAAHIITFPPDAPSYRAHRRDPPGRLPPDRRARQPRQPRRTRARR
jgi:DNA replication protein DnaC